MSSHSSHTHFLDLGQDLLLLIAQILLRDDIVDVFHLSLACRALRQTLSPVLPFQFSALSADALETLPRHTLQWSDYCHRGVVTAYTFEVLNASALQVAPLAAKASAALQFWWYGDCVFGFDVVSFLTRCSNFTPMLDYDLPHHHAIDCNAPHTVSSSSSSSSSSTSTTISSSFSTSTSSLNESSPHPHHPLFMFGYAWDGTFHSILQCLASSSSASTAPAHVSPVAPVLPKGIFKGDTETPLDRCLWRIGPVFNARQIAALLLYGRQKLLDEAASDSSVAAWANTLVTLFDLACCAHPHWPVQIPKSIDVMKQENEKKKDIETEKKKDIETEKKKEIETEKKKEIENEMKDNEKAKKEEQRNILLDTLNVVCNTNTFWRYDGHFCAHSCGELFARPFLDLAGILCYSGVRFEEEKQETEAQQESTAISKIRTFSLRNVRALDPRHFLDFTLPGVALLLLAHLNERKPLKTLMRVKNARYSGDAEWLASFDVEESLPSHVYGFQRPQFPPGARFLVENASYKVKKDKFVLDEALHSFIIVVSQYESILKATLLSR